LFDPICYYSPETTIFPVIAQHFADTGHLDPIAFYLILDWKSPRARTRHLLRLARISGSFKTAVDGIAADLTAAVGPQQQLEALLTTWGFRLPTATAILTVLYPGVFTVYDIRVCNTLGKFHQLGNGAWEAASWPEYERFIDAVRETAPPGLSLRDCDRWLWGKDKQKTLHDELENLMVVADSGSKG
jgi:hypothetical protein